jgi:hypothetical protein
MFSIDTASGPHFPLERISVGGPLALWLCKASGFFGQPGK